MFTNNSKSIFIKIIFIDAGKNRHLLYNHISKSTVWCEVKIEI